jgi:hypothetical protein
VNWEPTGDIAAPFQATVNGRDWRLFATDDGETTFYSLHIDGEVRVILIAYDLWPVAWERPRVD